MLQELKREIKLEFEALVKRGQMDVQNVRKVTRDATARFNGDVNDVRKTTSGAIKISILTLEELAEANQETVSAAVAGVLEGIKDARVRLQAIADKDVRDAKLHLDEETENIASIIRESFEGAREAGNEFSESIQQSVGDTVSSAKIMASDLLGLTSSAVKEAVKQAIIVGEDVDETVRKITQEATNAALSEARFSADRARKVSETILSAAVEAAEESGKSVQEVSSAAAEGVREGLMLIIDQTRKSFATSNATAKKITARELHEIRDDLDLVGDLFVQTLHRVADRSTSAAKNVLNELAEDARKAGSSLRELAAKTGHLASQSLKELGVETLRASEKVTQSVASEVREMGEHMLAIAKGAAVGMWNGATKAIEREDEQKKDQS